VTDVWISPYFDPKISPALPEFQTRAIWDTGATNTNITQAVVDALHLAPVSATVINTAGGPKETSIYLINVGLPSRVDVVGIFAPQMDAVGHGIGALIGMDIISQGDFAVTNVDGKTCVSFRSPSVSQIDYVAMARQMGNVRPGPNEPCPCGRASQDGEPLKYKKCCGRTPHTA